MDGLVKSLDVSLSSSTFLLVLKYQYFMSFVIATLGGFYQFHF